MHCICDSASEKHSIFLTKEHWVSIRPHKQKTFVKPSFECLDSALYTSACGLLLLLLCHKNAQKRHMQNTNNIMTGSIKRCSTAPQVVKNSTGYLLTQLFPNKTTFSPSYRTGFAFSVAFEEQTRSWIIIILYLFKYSPLPNYIYCHITTTCYLHFSSVQGECFTNQRITMYISHFENSYL